MTDDKLKQRTTDINVARAKQHPEEITLPLGSNADPDHCGSCKFFRRYLENGEWYVNGGACEIKLPPPKQRFLLKPVTESDCDWGPNKVKDTDRCDLYQPDGRIYIVQRRIPEERNG